MAGKSHRILVSYTPAEFEGVKKQAAQYRLSISEMHRRFTLGHTLPDPQNFVDAQHIRDLLKINADQARLGNLLKLALDESDGKWTPAMTAQVHALVGQIRDQQDALKAAVGDLHRRIHPRTKS